MWAWGANHHRTLGDGTDDNLKILPVQLKLKNIKQIVSGRDFSLAIKKDGTIVAWGMNLEGQIGNGKQGQGQSSQPNFVKDLKNVIQIAGEENHALALKEDRTVWAWGYNAFGQIGDGTIGESRLLPVQVIGLTNVKQVAAGYGYSLALKEDGTVWEWGINYKETFANNLTGNMLYPQKVDGITDIDQVVTGMGHSLALKKDGTLWAWRHGEVPIEQKIIADYITK